MCISWSTVEGERGVDEMAEFIVLTAANICSTAVSISVCSCTHNTAYAGDHSWDNPAVF